MCAGICDGTPLTCSSFFFMTPCHTIVVGYYGITLVVHVSVCCTSVSSFLADNLSKYQWIFTRCYVCALILRRSGLGLKMGKFCQFLTELSARNTSLF